MESPEFLYKEYSKIDNITDIAYDRLFTNYLILNLKGDNKMIEYNSTDQESLIAKMNMDFIPGIIYTFWYIPEEVLALTIAGKQKKFIDVAPIVFCSSVSPTHFSGINLNMLPVRERLKFLTEYYKVYKTFFEDVEERTENRQIAINTKFLEKSMMRKSQDIIKAFSARQSARFNYGYRKYDRQKIKQLRLIEFEEWTYLPFYEPKNAFKRINFKQIHDLYYRGG